MTKLEYSDFYKFLVSLGVVLVSLSLFIPWLFLHESFNVELKESEIAELTSTAQTLIRYRQYTALWFIQNICWISPLLAGCGVLSLIGGIILWGRRQRRVDQKESFETQKAGLETQKVGLETQKVGLETQKVGLEIEKLKRELEPLTPTEIAAKGVEEVKQEMEGEEIPEPVLISSVGSRVQEYFRIEQIFLDKLIACYGEERVLIQQRAGKGEYDAILLSDSSELADVVFEIKHLINPLRSGRLHETVEQTILLMQNYSVLFARFAIAIILFVVKEEEQASVVIDKHLWAIKDQAAQYSTTVHPIFLTEEELIGMQCSQLQAKIDKLAKIG